MTVHTLPRGRATPQPRAGPCPRADTGPVDPGHESVPGVRDPWLARHGLLVAAVLAATALLPALLGADDDPGALAVTAAQDAAPYGVAGCSPPAGAAPVDVAVSARALDAAGAPTGSLGADPAGGPQVGASVRDLAGYAAEDVAPCDVVQVTVHLHDGQGSVAGALAAAPGPLAVADQDARGELVAVDVATWAATLPAEVPAGALEDRAAWFVTLVDPVPGTYRLTGRVTAQTPPGAAGDVEVLVEVTPATTG